MALAALAVLVGTVIQSGTGLGFALVLSPALFAVLDPVDAVWTLLVLGLALNVLVLMKTGKRSVPRLRPTPARAGRGSRPG